MPPARACDHDPGNHADTIYTGLEESVAPRRDHVRVGAQQLWCERPERPSANSDNAVARTTLRCGNTDDRTIRSSSTRVSGDTSMT